MTWERSSRSSPTELLVGRVAASSFLNLPRLRKLGQASGDASSIEVQALGHLASCAPGMLAQELDDARLGVNLAGARGCTTSARSPSGGAAPRARRCRRCPEPPIGPDPDWRRAGPAQLHEPGAAVATTDCCLVKEAVENAVRGDRHARSRARGTPGASRLARQAGGPEPPVDELVARVDLPGSETRIAGPFRSSGPTPLVSTSTVPPSTVRPQSTRSNPSDFSTLFRMPKQHTKLPAHRPNHRATAPQRTGPAARRPRRGRGRDRGQRRGSSVTLRRRTVTPRCSSRHS